MMHELRIAFASRGHWVPLLLSAVLSVAAFVNGARVVDSQRQHILHVEKAQREEFAQTLKHFPPDAIPAGDLGYYGFYTVSHTPAPLAFVAIGQRDIQPDALRMRLLGLQSQLHEGETINPELARLGTFDYAFVLVYLLPLFAIVLLHDVVVGEREQGRMRLLLSLRPGAYVWWRRAGLRALALWVAMVLPLAVACMLRGVPFLSMALSVLVATALLLVWAALALWVSARARDGAQAAMRLLALWVLACVVLPVAADALIRRSVPAGKGVELMLAQREVVHDAWDLPRAETLAKFAKTHPEWRDTAPVTGRFHWKWYYAAHQLGDESVAPAYRAWSDALRRREHLANALGLLLPNTAAQGALHRMAQTDLTATLAWKNRVAAWHTRLRHYFYPYLFNDVPMRSQDVAGIPQFAATPAPTPVPWGLVVALCGWALTLVGLSMQALRRMRG